MWRGFLLESSANFQFHQHYTNFPIIPTFSVSVGITLHFHVSVTLIFGFSKLPVRVFSFYLLIRNTSLYVKDIVILVCRICYKYSPI